MAFEYHNMAARIWRRITLYHVHRCKAKWYDDLIHYLADNTPPRFVVWYVMHIKPPRGNG